MFKITQLISDGMGISKIKISGQQIVPFDDNTLQYYYHGSEVRSGAGEEHLQRENCN